MVRIVRMVRMVWSLADRTFQPRSLSREEKLAVLDHQKTRAYAGSRCLYPELFDPGSVLRWIDPALLKVFAG